MSIFGRNKIKQQHIIRKEFSYSKGLIALKFNLRIDQKNELEDFKELMVQALKDIEQIINN